MNQKSNDNKQIINQRLDQSKNNLIDLLGILVAIIVGKEYFKRNSEVGLFIEEILGVTFPEYVIRSRTLMAARACRLVINYEEKETEKIIYKINLKLKEIMSEEEKSTVSPIKKNKKKNENDKLEKWLKGF